MLSVPESASACRVPQTRPSSAPACRLNAAGGLDLTHQFDDEDLALLLEQIIALFGERQIALIWR